MRPPPPTCIIILPGNSDARITHSPCYRIIDVIAFSIILATARRPGMRRYPGVPSLLDTIMRDATQYFMLIFFVQLVAELLLFVAPVCDM